jgi:protein-tyrosine phosphatase
MKHIMFVCLGNICRSPAAEAVFRHITTTHNKKDRYHADSAGTAAYHIGSQADARMRRAADARGIRITHRGQQLKPDHLRQFDLILCMDKENLADARSLTTVPEELAKIKLLRDFDPKGTGDVPDPYYGGPEGFETVLDIVERSATSLLEHLENE